MSGHEQTPLEMKLIARIRAEGPISVGAYMAACLMDREHGYYRTRDAIGRTGDFITAPEISQVFGELIGLWAIAAWQGMGSPSPVSLVEWGPGRGTLMADLLRTARVVPEFRAALKVRLMEANPRLIAAQRQALAGVDVPVTWDAPAQGGSGSPDDGPTILIANEVLDAMPVEQLVWRGGVGGGWHRRTVGVDAGGRLKLGEDDAPLAGLGTGGPAPADGTISESRDLTGLVRHLRTMAAHGLAALFIDYGHDGGSHGETLQAVRAHRHVGLFDRPGESDLSALVDFRALKAAVAADGAGEIAADGPLSQAAFLDRLGAVTRASRLMAQNPERAGEIEAGVTRLLAPAGMGGRFLGLGVRGAGQPPLPGLGEA